MKAIDIKKIILDIVTSITNLQSKGRAFEQLTGNVSLASGESKSFSIEITTLGGPIFIIACGNWNGTTNGAWAELYISRGSTVLMQTTMVSTTASHNCPGSVAFLDYQPAGTYTYTCTLASGSGAGTFSENNGGRPENPILCAFEL